MNEIRLNLGCGSRPLPGYINVDVDPLHVVKSRYPNLEIPEIEIFQYDIFNLPYADATVDEIRTESMLEHLSFKEEKAILFEVKRVLKVGGLFDFSVPDFDDLVRLWSVATDDWQDFFRDDDEAILKQHWFGQYSYSTDNKWGYLTASIFGPQCGEGQFHKNCYTKKKVQAILSRLGFKEEEISTFRWKGDRDLMIRAKAIKQ